MSRPYKYGYSPSGAVEPDDWDAMVDRVGGVTLDGVRAYPYTYLIRKNGGVCEAIDHTANLVFGGSTDEGEVDGDDAAAVIQAALDNAIINHGKVHIKAGAYSQGTTAITVTDDSDFWSLEFEPGAVLTYTGTDAAIQITADTRGDIRDFSIIHPQIHCTNAGTGIAVDGGYKFAIVNPYVDVDGAGVAIDLENLNTCKIYGGGYLIGDGTAGSIGIQLGEDSTNATDKVVEVQIDIFQISGFTHGITVGPSTWLVAAENIYIRDAFIGANAVGIQLYAVGGLTIEGCFFEVNTVASIKVLNEGSNAPTNFNINNNIFSEGVLIYDFDSGTDQYMNHLTALGNVWGDGKIRFSNNTTQTTVDYTRSTGAISQTTTFDWSNNIYNTSNKGIEAVGAGLDTVTVTLPYYTDSTTYHLIFYVGWNTTFWVSERQAGQFTLTFGSVAPGGGSYLYWRQG